jgi:hypothetical protein
MAGEVCKLPSNSVAFRDTPKADKLGDSTILFNPRKVIVMAKPHRTLKKANHGSRPANSKARRLKRKDVRT